MVEVHCPDRLSASVSGFLFWFGNLVFDRRLAYEPRIEIYLTPPFFLYSHSGSLLNESGGNP